MSDITAKLSDATTQANAALSETTSLMPDLGDATVSASNTTALKDARSKIKTATGDLTSTRKDFTTVVQALKDKTSATAPATTTQ
jgi:hypothetical protein